MASIFDEKIAPSEYSRSVSSASSEASHIEDSFNGKSMFLTGGTGMMGVCTLARLALDTPIEKIYTLSRGGDDRLWKRLAELLPNTMVEQMKASGKILGVDGDITKPNMGIEVEQLNTIKSEVHFVVHTASTLHLRHKLPKIAENVIFPSIAMADLALDCPQLEKFVYVSTAYTNAFLHFAPGVTIDKDVVIDEKFYPLNSRGEDNAQVELANILEYGTTPEYSCMGHPFAYSYAKHLTERLISQLFRKVEQEQKLMIFRPSCFGPAEKRPFPQFEVPGSVPVTTVLASVFASAPGICSRYSSNLSDPKTANVDEVPVDVVVDRLIVHLAVQTSGPVHAVASEKRRPVDGLLRAGCKLRKFWWGSPRLRWCNADTAQDKLSFISKTFGVLGCSLLFKSDRTQQVWNTMNPSERHKWHLFPDREGNNMNDLPARSIIARQILEDFMRKRHKLPPWLTNQLSKRPTCAKPGSDYDDLASTIQGEIKV